ncbi:hypothetical protein [Butyrivibrio sp. YAB3001]|uniref:hypothetical protein n=1 Tax=Butyrivibrio sp. YAB3001 TaxID=1520812 RepID=UPI0008F64CE0|nr:hypothetical protein [Butyrivibrio sp. YAB3001]SFB86763.1 hypothetical protein SAMN02910398_00930 [Butyrivibrio sp. YAB3001]
MPNRNEYLNKYKKENYKRIPLDVTTDKYEKIKNHAANRSESVNGFIKRAIDETMKRDSQ